jgi:hypothetical protein
VLAGAIQQRGAELLVFGYAVAASRRHRSSTMPKREYGTTRQGPCRLDSSTSAAE